MLLSDFLRAKPLYYTLIDYTRMPRVYKKISTHFKSIKTIHLVGTNGKGTTGRFLASALHKMGYKTGHYTSPHILEFNERIWMDGENVSNNSLELMHDKLQNMLSQEDAGSLSYFEYTTLLAMLVFHKCDYIVLEAGLGGVHDATAVFKKSLTLVTPIDYDHESFLGNHIRDIAYEKLGAIQNYAIIANQKYEDVLSVAQDMEQEKKLHISSLDSYIKNHDYEKIAIISKELGLAHYLEDNLKLAIASLNFFKLSYTPKHFKESKLFGRLSAYKKNIILDVGHNPLAASSILHALRGNKYTLIYNSYKDKDYKKILEILKPIVDSVEIIEINEKRIESLKILQNTLTDLEIKYNTFKEVKANKKYIVFGSFSVVQEFLHRTRNIVE